MDGSAHLYLIRARVGSTTPRQHVIDLTAPHPRPRGLDRHITRAASRQTTSSTPAWARQPRTHHDVHARHLIHARVDSTCGNAEWIWLYTPHPRPRGLDTRSVLQQGNCITSSTPAWARHALVNACHRYLHLTHACVGSTRALRAGDRGGTPHPRLRGLDISTSVPCRTPTTSPTPAWARRRAHLGRSPQAHLTHACVGSTSSISCRQRPTSPHPRLRGLDRARRTVDLPGPHLTHACVGSTVCQEEMRDNRTPHPRLRGLDRRFRSLSNQETPSPTPAWARRAYRTRCSGRHHLTHACVGSTGTWPP